MHRRGASTPRRMSAGTALAIAAGILLAGSSASAEDPPGLGPQAAGDLFRQEASLTDPDPAVLGRLGWAVAISGETALVGAPYDDVNGTESGSAYVFTRTGTTWTQQARLTPTGNGTLDHAGYAVDLDGDTAVVAAYTDDVGATDAGAVYVFTRDGTNWTQQAALTASDAAAYDNFGYSVAVAGDTVIVGAPFNDDAGGLSGSAYVFTRSDSTWTQQRKLTAPDASPKDRFGHSVALDADTAAIGAPFDATVPHGVPGSAYVFTRTGSTWSGQAKLMASDQSDEYQFGYSLALSGDTIVAGAPFGRDAAEVNNGRAYVFARDGVSWSEQAILVDATGASGDRFGNSVALEGGTAIVGAPQGSGDSGRTGTVGVFVRSVDTWARQSTITAVGTAVGDNLGRSVALDATTVLAGAPYDDMTVADAGSVAVVRLPASSLSINDVAAGEEAGSVVFTISRNGASGPASVDFRTVDGTATADADYTPESVTVEFAAGEATKTVDVPILDDSDQEGDETFTGVLSDPVNATISDGFATATILDDDSPRISISDGTVTEGNGVAVTARFMLVLSGPSAVPISVSYATLDSTAVAGLDYTAKTATILIPAGATSRAATVQVLDDSLDEPTEFLTVTLTEVTGAGIDRDIATGRIRDNDAPPSLSIADVSIIETDDGNTRGNLVITASAPSGYRIAIVVSTLDGTAIAPTDYAAGNSKRHIAAGETTISLPFTVHGDTDVEPDEFFIVVLSDPKYATIDDGSATVTIVNDD